MKNHIALWGAGLCFALAGHANAVPFYSQTPVVSYTQTTTDRHSGSLGAQIVDDFTLASPDTVRSVTWRGAYRHTDTPQVPLSFDLIFYSDINLLGGSLPYQLSSTTVVFTSLDDITDTGLTTAQGQRFFEFTANVTPTTLPAGKSWFSVLGDTTNDTNDNFFWAVGSDLDSWAYRQQVSNDGSFIQSSGGTHYFVLDNAQVPEPGSLALLAIGSLLAVRRRNKS